MANGCYVANQAAFTKKLYRRHEYLDFRYLIQMVKDGIHRKNLRVRLDDSLMMSYQSLT